MLIAGMKKKAIWFNTFSISGSLIFIVFLGESIVLFPSDFSSPSNPKNLLIFHSSLSFLNVKIISGYVAPPLEPKYLWLGTSSATIYSEGLKNIFKAF